MQNSKKIDKTAENHDYVVVSKANRVEVNRVEAERVKAERVKAERVIEKYGKLLKDFEAGIQIHLNNQAFNWNIKEGTKDGAVRFHNPPVYSYLGEIDVWESISSARDATIPYAFFMLRYIEGDWAKELGPKFIIRTDKSKTTAYDELDVYKMFEYYQEGHLKLREQDNEVSEAVKTLFEKNAEEFKYNIKKIYYHNADACNYLKDVEVILQSHACLTYSGRGPEKVLGIFLCYEIFNSINDPSLCPELSPQDDM